MTYLQLWFKAPADMQPIDPNFFTILTDYERVLTVLISELKREYWNVAVARNDHMVAAANAAGLEEALRLENERKRFGRELARLEMRVHELNSNTVNKLAETLQPSAATLLIEAFLVQAYPVVYPLDRRVLQLLDRLLGDEMTPSAARTLLASFQADLESTLEQSARQMTRPYIAWRVHLSEAAAYSPEEYRQYQSEMLRILGSQHKAQCRTLDLLAGILPNRLDEINALREAIETKFSAQSNPHGGRGMGWPDPFDDYDRKQIARPAAANLPAPAQSLK